MKPSTTLLAKSTKITTTNSFWGNEGYCKIKLIKYLSLIESLMHKGLRENRKVGD